MSKIDDILKRHEVEFSRGYTELHELEFRKIMEELVAPVTVLEIRGKGEELGQLMVLQFHDQEAAQEYIDEVNKEAEEKHYKYAEIIEIGKLYEPFITRDKKHL